MAEPHEWVVRRAYIEVAKLHKVLEVHDNFADVLEPACAMNVHHFIHDCFRVKLALVNVSIDVPAITASKTPVVDVMTKN